MSIPNAWGLKYEEVISLAWLAYKGQGRVGKWEFPNAKSKWNLKQVYSFGPFNAVVVEGKKRVLSFSGTDEGLDWVDNIQQGVMGFSVQYLNALTLAKAVSPDVVVGHSLGGGLASYVGIYHGKHAVTVNPAALNINLVSGVQMLRNHHLIFNYVARGEILDVVDKYAPNMKRVGRIHYLPPGKSNSTMGKHSLKNLPGFKKPKDITVAATVELMDGTEDTLERRINRLVRAG